MGLLGGTALCALAGRVAADLTPPRTIGRVATLIILALSTLLLPPELAAASLGTGWLISFPLNQRAGWALFSLGLGLLGRGALLQCLRPATSFGVTLGISADVAIRLVVLLATIAGWVGGAGRSRWDSRPREQV